MSNAMQLATIRNQVMHARDALRDADQLGKVDSANRDELDALRRAIESLACALDETCDAIDRGDHAAPSREGDRGE